AAVTGTTMVFRDWEAPFDLALVYTVTVYDGTTAVGTASVTVTVPWGDCEVWLVDLARPTNSLEVVVESFVALDFAVAAGVHRVLNRRAPVMTTLPAWTPAGELIVLTDTLAQRDQVRSLLGSGYPFLLRTTPDLGVGNMCLGLTDFVEERFLTPGFAAQRRFRIAAVQVERPDPALFQPTPPNTYQHVKDTWASYAALLAAVGTYDALAYTFPDLDDATVIPPWLPDDI
ncbi:MAG TPA: hypothetical protein VFA62_03615, partial [Acidimicrobiia bacterium]|nr:hypothetical protein [Acidimicrobiia bacterium]